MPRLAPYYIYQATLILTLVVESAAAYYHEDSDVLLVTGLPLFFLATGLLIQKCLYHLERRRVAQRG